MLDALGLVNGSLWHNFKSTELSFNDNQVDGPKFSISNLHARIFVKELLLGWLLRLCTLLLLFFSRCLSIATGLLDRRKFG